MRRRPPRHPRIDAARVRAPRPARHAAAHPGVRQRDPDQSRDGRRHRAVGARSAAAATRALHRRRVRRCLRAVDPRHAAARHAHGLRPLRLSARRRAVPLALGMGRDLEIERRRAALSRSGLPQPARAGALLFPRVLRPARTPDAAQLFRGLRPAPRRSPPLGHARRTRAAMSTTGSRRCGTIRSCRRGRRRACRAAIRSSGARRRWSNIRRRPGTPAGPIDARIVGGTISRRQEPWGAIRAHERRRSEATPRGDSRRGRRRLFAPDGDRRARDRARARARARSVSRARDGASRPRHQHGRRFGAGDLRDGGRRRHRGARRPARARRRVEGASRRAPAAVSHRRASRRRQRARRRRRLRRRRQHRRAAAGARAAGRHRRLRSGARRGEEPRRGRRSTISARRR